MSRFGCTLAILCSGLAALRANARARAAAATVARGVLRIPDGASARQRRRCRRCACRARTCEESRSELRRDSGRGRRLLREAEQGARRRSRPPTRHSSSIRATSRRITCSPSCTRPGRTASCRRPRVRRRSASRQQAIDHLTAIQNSPIMATDPNLQMSFGRLQVRAGRAAQAVPILERVAAQVPWSAEPLALLAEARSLVGQLDGAAEALQGAAEINPRYWAPLGELYDRLDRPEEAAEAYGEAVQRARNPSRDLRLRWATALLSVPNGGGADKAREVLGRAAEGVAERRARAVSAGDRAARERPVEGSRGDRPKDSRDRFDQRERALRPRPRAVRSLRVSPGRRGADAVREGCGEPRQGSRARNRRWCSCNSASRGSSSANTTERLPRSRRRARSARAIRTWTRIWCRRCSPPAATSAPRPRPATR